VSAREPVRCKWVSDDPLYRAYHDLEWGVPEKDDRALFEKLILDGFQAGLSWITILRKRENFRRAFDGFDPERIARYRRRGSRAPRRSGHRAEPPEGGGDRDQCPGLPDAATGARSFSEFLWQFTGAAPG